MYPGGWDWSLPEWGKKEENNSNFDNPESSDYISASPAFDTQHEKERKERSERIDREFRQSCEQARKDMMHAKFMRRILRPLAICLWLLVVICAYCPQFISYLVK
jgi:hypothetical protein